MSDQPKCIDISHWQGHPDFAKVRAAGVIACIMKATEGNSYVEPNRAHNYVAATKAGIKCCTYHWLKPFSAKSQIAHYLATIDPVRGERVVIDYEEGACTLAVLKEAVQALLDDPRALQVTIYSGHLLKEQLGSKHDAFLAEHTDLWLAQYTTGTPTWPNATYPQWTLWQYSEKGSVSGINGTAVDLDRFNGPDDALLRWISPRAALPSPEPKSEHAIIPVSIALTVPAGVTVTIMLNGEIIRAAT
jgi:lysozyme